MTKEREEAIRRECEEEALKAVQDAWIVADQSIIDMSAERTAYYQALFRERLRAEELVDLLREATSICKYHACPQCGKTGKEVGMMQVGRPTGTNPLDGKPSAASALRMDVETCTVCQGRSALLSRIEEATK